MKIIQKSYGNRIKNGIFTHLQLLGTQLFGVYKKTTYLCQRIPRKPRIEKGIQGLKEKSRIKK